MNNVQGQKTGKFYDLYVIWSNIVSIEGYGSNTVMCRRKNTKRTLDVQAMEDFMP